jgi:hypothetical protein
MCVLVSHLEKRATGIPNLALRVQSYVFESGLGHVGRCVGKTFAVYPLLELINFTDESFHVVGA